MDQVKADVKSALALSCRGCEKSKRYPGGLLDSVKSLCKGRDLRNIAADGFYYCDICLPQLEKKPQRKQVLPKRQGFLSRAP